MILSDDPPEVLEDLTSDVVAIWFLIQRGYVLTQQFFWWLPYPGHEPTLAENKALDYLFAEWDFGGIVSEYEGTEGKFDP